MVSFGMVAALPLHQGLSTPRVLALRQNDG
jgi:hypothetical protein